MLEWSDSLQTYVCDLHSKMIGKCYTYYQYLASVYFTKQTIFFFSISVLNNIKIDNIQWIIKFFAPRRAYMLYIYFMCIYETDLSLNMYRWYQTVCLYRKHVTISHTTALGNFNAWPRSFGFFAKHCHTLLFGGGMLQTIWWRHWINSMKTEAHRMLIRHTTLIQHLGTWILRLLII